MTCPDEASLRWASGGMPPVLGGPVMLHLGMGSSSAEKIEDADQWQQFLLEPGTKECVRVGRAKDNDLQVSVKGVSTYHLEFRLAGAPQDGSANGAALPGVVICDISTNGTALKLGEKVERLQKDLNTPVVDGAAVVFPMKVKAESESDKESSRALLFVRLTPGAVQVPPTQSLSAPAPFAGASAVEPAPALQQAPQTSSTPPLQPPQLTPVMQGAMPMQPIPAQPIPVNATAPATLQAVDGNSPGNPLLSMAVSKAPSAPPGISSEGTSGSWAMATSVSKSSPSVPPNVNPGTAGKAAAPAIPQSTTSSSPPQLGIAAGVGAFPQVPGFQLPGGIASVPPGQSPQPLMSVTAAGTEGSTGVAAFAQTSPGSLPGNPMAAAAMQFGAAMPNAGLPGMQTAALGGMMPGMLGGVPGAPADANAMTMLMMQNPAMAQYYAQIQQLQMAQAAQQAQLQQALLMNRPPLAVNPPPPAFGGGAVNFGSAAPPSSSGNVTIPDNLKDKEKEIDALCDSFGLDYRSKANIVQRLTKRIPTFEEDIESLHEILKEARNPPALLTVKLKQMDDGSFTTRTEVKARMAAREAAARKQAAEKAKEEAAALQKENDEAKAKERKEEKDGVVEKKEGEVEVKESEESKDDDGADTKEPKKGASGAPARREGMRPGDWLCPKCDYLNFARNRECLKCSERKPATEGEPERKGAEGRTSSPHRKYERRRSRSRDRSGGGDRRKKRSRSRSRSRRRRSRSRGRNRSRRRSRSRKRRSPSRKRGRSKSRKRSRSRSRSRSRKKEDKKARKASSSRSRSAKKDDKKSYRSRSASDKKDDKKAKKASRSRSSSKKKDDTKGKQASRSRSSGGAKDDKKDEKKDDKKDGKDEKKDDKKKKDAKSSSSSSSS